MRCVVNISLPSSLSAVVKKEVKRGKYASTSEYFRTLVRNQELARELEKSSKEFAAGKGGVLRSLRDLR